MNRWTRLAPLTGLVYLALILVTFFASPSTPNSNATGHHVISFFEAHQNGVKVTSIVGVFAALFFLFFAASFRSHLRARLAPDGPLALGFGGAILLAAGLTSLLALNWALADVPTHLDPSSAQALNVLDNDVFFPFLLGSCVFMLASGFVIVNTGAVPRWLGWVALVFGVGSVTPAGWFVFLFSTVWVGVVALLLFLRAGRTVPSVEATPPEILEPKPAAM